jgi:cytoskeleton protein RodZ
MTQAQSDSPGSSESQMTAGQLLREARTRQGLHLAVLSVALKVPVRTLELLENDQHDALPGPTFVRALASSICRQLRIDPAQVLLKLPGRQEHMAPPPPTLEGAEGVTHAGSSPLWHSDRRNWAVLLIAALMMVVIAGLLWWPSGASHPEPVQNASEPLTGFMPPAGASVQDPPASAPTAQSRVTADLSAALPASSPSPAPAVSAPVEKPVTQPPPVTLRFSAMGESWIEVRSAEGQMVFSKVMQAGEKQDITHPAPLKVVVGRAAVVQAQVAGRPFDLAPHTKITVARFEVSP